MKILWIKDIMEYIQSHSWFILSLSILQETKKSIHQIEKYYFLNQIKLFLSLIIHATKH